MNVKRNHEDINLKKSDRIKSFGHSMYPILHDGDVIFYKKIPYKNIKVNDIVVLKETDNYITHRVVYKDQRFIVTKGDNNKNIDAKVFPDRIVGVVHKVKRGKTLFYPETYYLLQSSLYFTYITKIITLLKNENIPYVLLKGLPLHLKYKAEHPQRKFFDFDILVPPVYRDILLQKLRELGFQIRYDFLSSTHERLMDKHIEETCMKNIDGFIISVDIHYEAVFMMTQIGTLNELYQQKYIDAFTHDLYLNTTYYKTHELRCRLLRDEYLLVYLAMHFFHHSFKGWYRLSLLATVIESVPDKNRIKFWRNIASIIKKYRLEGYIYGTFISLSKYFPEIEIPGNFLNKIKPTSKQLHYLNNYFSHEKIYEEFTTTRAGILLFRNLYTLSYNPWYQKLTVFFRPAVLYMIVWLGYFFIVTRIKKLLANYYEKK